MSAFERLCARFVAEPDFLSTAAACVDLPPMEATLCVPRPRAPIEIEEEQTPESEPNTEAYFLSLGFDPEVVAAGMNAGVTFEKRLEVMIQLQKDVSPLVRHFRELDDGQYPCQTAETAFLARFSTTFPAMSGVTPTSSHPPRLPDTPFFRPSPLQEAILGHILLSGVSLGLLVLATGLGKTILSLMLAEQMWRTGGEPPVVLFLVHTKAILQGAAEKYRRHFGAHLVSTTPQVSRLFNFCLFQSFHHLGAELLSSVTLLIIDEAHHLLAPTFQAILSCTPLLSNLRGAIGMTATLCHRNDPQGKQLADIFGGNILIDLPWTAAKRFGLFPPVHYYELSTAAAYPFQEVADRLEKRDVSLSRFATFVMHGLPTTAPTPQEICMSMDRFISSATVLPSRVLVFTSTIKACDATTTLLQRALQSYDVTSLHSRTPAGADDVLQAFCQPHTGARETGKVIVSVGMLSEGVDCPAVDLVVLARPTESEVVFAQQLGRGLRRVANRSVAVLDLCGNLRRRWTRLISARKPDVRELIGEFWQVIVFAGEE